MLNSVLNPNAIELIQIRQNFNALYYSFVATWEGFPRSARQMSSNSLSSTVTLLELPPGGVVYGVKLKRIQAFNASVYTMSVGITGELDRFIASYDVTAGESGTGFIIDGPLMDSFNDDAATNITLTATSDVNTNLATRGKVNVWIYWSQIR